MSNMAICYGDSDYEHAQIMYELPDKCPLCEVIVKMREAQVECRKLTKDVAELERDIQDFRNE